MSDIDTDKIIKVLRKLAKIMASDSGYSESDILKARTLAAKLYVMHSNREITLNAEHFNLVLDIIQFDPTSVNEEV